MCVHTQCSQAIKLKSGGRWCSLCTFTLKLSTRLEASNLEDIYEQSGLALCRHSSPAASGSWAARAHLQCQGSVTSLAAGLGWLLSNPDSRRCEEMCMWGWLRPGLLGCPASPLCRTVEWSRLSSLWAEMLLVEVKHMGYNGPIKIIDWVYNYYYLSIFSQRLGEGSCLFLWTVHWGTNLQSHWGGTCWINVSQ